MMNTHREPENRDGRRGFTIVELLIVISIMAILTSVSLPAATSWIANYRLKVAAGDVFAALQLAKSTALKENGDVVVWFNTANNSYRLFLDNGAGGGTSGNHTQDGGEVTIKDGTIQSGVDMYNTSFSSWSNQTYFNSRGLAKGGWGYVFLKSEGYSDRFRRVTVWTTGHLELEQSSDGVNWS